MHVKSVESSNVPPVGVVVRRGEVPAQVTSSSLDHGSKSRSPSPKALVELNTEKNCPVLRNSEKANGSSLPPSPRIVAMVRKEREEEKGEMGHRVTCVISVKKLDNCPRLRLVILPTF
ncbi:uncharacterized protein TNCV_3462071 [Trichonephila clavipes]|nr:uncharacterized protein TNCV_3462071 [Trichonephila clavipes]